MPSIEKFYWLCACVFVGPVYVCATYFVHHFNGTELNLVTRLYNVHIVWHVSSPSWCTMHRLIPAFWLDDRAELSELLSSCCIFLSGSQGTEILRFSNDNVFDNGICLCRPYSWHCITHKAWLEWVYHYIPFESNLQDPFCLFWKVGGPWTPIF